MLKLLCTLMLMTLGALPACAAELFGTPVRVMLGPKDAQITAEQEVPVTAGQDGRAEARFLLPKDSFDMKITAKDRDVEDWSHAKMYLDKQAQHERRIALTKELTAVEGEIESIRARLALWKTGGVKEPSFDDLDKRDSRMQQIIPELHVKLHELAEQAKDLKADRDILPFVSKEAVLVTASLSGPAKGTVKLFYTYFTSRCSWRPLYRFTALPDQELVLVHLSAEIRKNIGQDWNDAEITLVSHNASRQALDKLSPWLVENQATAPAVFYSAAREPSKTLAPKLKQTPAIQMVDRSAFASWELGRRTLREGTSRLTIRETEWKAPIFRLARPSMDKTAFIAARYTVDEPHAWPGGSASHFLDGAFAGFGTFVLDGNTATLFFGADPRVTVERKTDSRQSGRSGIIINKRRNWEWKWTFKAFNGSSKPVLLRVEDVQPQAGDKDIAISMNSKPEPKLDEDHTLYWELKIPANQGADIIHSVTVSAPADMLVDPGR